MDLKNQPGTFHKTVRVPAEATAGDADTWSLFVAVQDMKVTAVKWIPDAAVSGADTNNFSLTTRNEGSDGTGTTAVTSAKTYASGTDSVAQTPESLTLSTTAADLLIDSGEVLSLVRAVNGTGLASPAGAVQAEYQHV